MDNLSGKADESEVQADDTSHRQCVCHAALEDEVHIHEPEAHDGVAEGQRQEDKGQNAEPERLTKHATGEEREDVEHGEGLKEQEDTARDPPHLLDKNRTLGLPA